jgi:hypothetical protein
VAEPVVAVLLGRRPTGAPDTFTESWAVELVATPAKLMPSPPTVPVSPNVADAGPATKVLLPPVDPLITVVFVRLSQNEGSGDALQDGGGGVPTDGGAGGAATST